MENDLPPIPAKRYFTIGEVADLCGVKPHVLRYWEQEFTQLRPMKRRGNRRYYQHHEVLMVRRIRELLYDQGFTIIGARNKMQALVSNHPDLKTSTLSSEVGIEVIELSDSFLPHALGQPGGYELQTMTVASWESLRRELLAVRMLLGTDP